MVRAQVHSTKHYNQITLTTVATGTTVGVNLANAVNRTVANIAEEVVEGCTIKAFYFELWTIGSVSDQFYTLIIGKIPGGVPNYVNADLVDLFNYANKKNIFYTMQGLASNDGIGNPVVAYKGWIKIPKGKQRFGLGDRIQFAVASRGSATITICGLGIYKEYT